MTRFYLVSISLFVFLTCLGQKKLDKIVFLTATQSPIDEVFIRSKTTGFEAFSNENGAVYLQNLPEHDKLLYVSRLGFESTVIALDSIVPSNGWASVVLKRKELTLRDIIVVSPGRRTILQVLKDMDIRMRPVTNSQEVLRLVPGLFIGQHAGGGKAEQLFLRGFDLDHGTDINLTVDGLPVNMVSHAHGQGYADLHFVIPELVEKVQFQKGPYAANMGNFTTAGYVALKTRDRLEKNFIKTEGGQFGHLRVAGGVNLLKPVPENALRSFYVALEAAGLKGYFDHPQNFRRFNALTKYQTAFGRNGSLTALASAFRSRWNASGQIPERAVYRGDIGFFGAIDPTEGGETSRYNTSLEIKGQAGRGAQWRSQVFYSRYAFQLYSNFTFFKLDPVNGDRIRQKENRNIYGYNGMYQKDYTIGELHAATIAGVQFRHDDINGNELSGVTDQNVVISKKQLGDVAETNTAVYVSQRVMLHKRLTVNASLRFDHFRNRYRDHLTAEDKRATAVIFSPKLTFDYVVNRNIQLYWYNGRGFHSNDTRVAVAQKGKKVLPPAYSTDIGGIFKLAPKLLVQTAIWQLWLDQEFIYVGDEGVVEPGGRTSRTGLDLSVRYEMFRNFFASVDLNYSSSKLLEEPKAANAIPLAPRLTSTGGLTYKKQTGFSASIFYRLMGDRPAMEDRSLTAGGYCLVDANILYSKAKWEVGLMVQNLLNAKWKETQFATESRLKYETDAITEMHFTPGSPFFARLQVTRFF